MKATIGTFYKKEPKDFRGWQVAIKYDNGWLVISKKQWGLRGKQNGMYGKCGKQNPNWDGGHSPERQSQYARFAWKELAKTILKRDNYKCKRCGANHNKNNKLVVHHIKQWSKYPELRFEPTNLITICNICHKKIHSKKK